MARSILTIKEGMTKEFMANTDIQKAYGNSFTSLDIFEHKFSKVSVENIFFYIMATCCWTLESLFDNHKAEVDAIIENILPHRPKWYADKALKFQYGCDLLLDADVYGQIDESKKIVKYATASEMDGKLVIKVAKGEQANLKSLDDHEYSSFSSYMQAIKDAGVALSIVSGNGDSFSCNIMIYYSTMRTQNELEYDVRKAIKNYIQNLPFNGEYSNMGLIDAVQKVDGVRIAELKNAFGENVQIIDRRTPRDGYFVALDSNITITLKSYFE